MIVKDNWSTVSSLILLPGCFLLSIFPVAAFIPQPDIRIVIALFSMPLFLLLSVLIPCIISCGKDLWSELGLKLPEKSDILPVLSAIPVFFIFALVLALWRKFTGHAAPQFLVSYAENCPGWQFILILFTAGILAPISEELAFRRCFSGYISKVFPGVKLAYYLLPSLLFAVCHGLILQSVLLFFFALYLQRNQINGSTTRSILMHSLFNWCSLIILILIRAEILPKSF